MTPAGIVLKGSGFYKTDNRSGSKRSGGDGGEKQSEKSDSKGDSKGDGAGGDGVHLLLEEGLERVLDAPEKLGITEP